MEQNKKDLLEKIVDLEVKLFTSMKTEEEIPANTLPAFRKMRWMTYSVLSEKTLSAWLTDLTQAIAEGRNTMIEKYLMIDGKMPLPDEEEGCCCTTISKPIKGQRKPICSDLDIAEIVEIENHWQEQAAQKYPRSIQRMPDEGEAFMHYLMCELHTWKPTTVKLYREDVQKAVDEGRNLAVERYNNLYASIGKGSLAQVDARAIRR